ncbi:MAG TPA: hypothetical protein VK470_17735 [Bacteroidota bacterium]|nr:hypothetical protein [Bacteroidota bacterium]
MRKLGYMKPQDIAVLLKIISMNGKAWKMMDLASQLFISQSEISHALERNRLAGLIDDEKRHVHRTSLMEFLAFGIKYCFPVKPGEIVRGIPTAHSAEPLCRKIQSNIDIYVWQDTDGSLRGQKIEPLFLKIPKAVQEDPVFYEMTALIDAIRVGKSREYQIAVDLLRKRIQNK